MSFSFGQQGAKPLGSTTSFGGTSLFGQQKTNQPATFGSAGGLNATTNQQNTNAQGQTSLFGNKPLFGQTQTQPAANTTGSLFGNTNTGLGQSSVTQPTNLFGQTNVGAPNASTAAANTSTTAQAAPSLFTWNGANTSTNKAAETSTMGLQGRSFLGSSTAAPGQLGSSIMNTSTNQAAAASQLTSLQAEFEKIQNAWNLAHPDCAFQRYFYNKVPPEQAGLYVKPPNHNQQKWDEAVAKRPNNSVVPVLAVGFADVQKRINMQKQLVNAYRLRMHEIVKTLEGLHNKHELDTTIKLTEAKSRHVVLSERVLRLAIKVHVLRHRGYALKSNEEELRKKLDDLSKSLNNPQAFGRLNEIWARITLLFESENEMLSGEQRNALFKGAIDWQKNEGQLDTVADVLRDHQTGLSYLTKLIKQDLEGLNGILDNEMDDEKAM
ncbi:nucleoporin Nup44 [Schizosaccharomyces japonicus yFS275]|uniref:Nucleoporin Nup44 n=1 Tax=Schizosaccharomyces japonicus (strain yFS275 / FY16936) TaxID=402676 RepID=B6K1V0_SCHJY|nr:nucleoporin Nup44 [Schizosaccharomyces japonicus yFS275]EEB07131.1 nucleoporin Nup44 [Schizosaccharomyces japonicus yFS275]